MRDESECQKERPEPAGPIGMKEMRHVRESAALRTRSIGPRRFPGNGRTRIDPVSMRTRRECRKAASLLRAALGGLGPLVQVRTLHLPAPLSAAGSAGNRPHMIIGPPWHVGELGGPGLVSVLVPVGLHPRDLAEPQLDRLFAAQEAQIEKVLIVEIELGGKVLPRRIEESLLHGGLDGYRSIPGRIIVVGQRQPGCALVHGNGKPEGPRPCSGFRVRAVMMPILGPAEA